MLNLSYKYSIVMMFLKYLKNLYSFSVLHFDFDDYFFNAPRLICIILLMRSWTIFLYSSPSWYLLPYLSSCWWQFSPLLILWSHCFLHSTMDGIFLIFKVFSFSWVFSEVFTFCFSSCFLAVFLLIALRATTCPFSLIFRLAVAG